MPHGRGAGIAHGEPLTRHAVEIHFPAGRAIETNVADQNVFFRHEPGIARRINNQRAAGEPFSHIVVGFAFERERYTLRQERAKALPRAAVELNADGVIRQARGAMAPRDLPAEHSADGAMHVSNRQAERHGREILDGLAGLFDQFAVEGIVQAVVLRLRATPSHVARHRRVVEYGGQVDPLGLPVFDVLALRQAIHAANHLIELAEAKLRHDPAEILRHIEQEVDHVFGLPLKFLTSAS